MPSQLALLLRPLHAISRRPSKALPSPGGMDDRRSWRAAAPPCSHQGVSITAPSGPPPPPRLPVSAASAAHGSQSAPRSPACKVVVNTNVSDPVVPIFRDLPSQHRQLWPLPASKERVPASKTWHADHNLNPPNPNKTRKPETGVRSSDASCLPQPWRMHSALRQRQTRRPLRRSHNLTSFARVL